MHFVYRSHCEGQLSKRVRRLPDESVLNWFRRGWHCDDPESWVENELGGDVYGLDSVFEAARKHGLSRPATTSELRELLHEHLYVEGDEDFICLDDHSLRVRTDDDEVELAYLFLDDEVVAGRSPRPGPITAALQQPLGSTQGLKAAEPSAPSVGTSGC